MLIGALFADDLIKYFTISFKCGWLRRELSFTPTAESDKICNVIGLAQFGELPRFAFALLSISRLDGIN